MLTRSLTLVLLVLPSVLAQAGEIKEFRARIRMARIDQLAELCGVNRTVWACTSFAAPSLTCHCTRVEAGWSIDGTARYLPYLILSDRIYVRHEMQHLADIRAEASRYLTELSQRSYDSEEQCLAAARVEQLGFASKLDQFKFASIAKRDTPESLEEVRTRATGQIARR